MLQPGSIFDGRYEIVQVLGIGGYATVYKAVQTDLCRTVALKVYHASISEDEHFSERCKREALALNSLSHQNIVTVYHIGQSDYDNLLYLVMEFIRGENLRVLINREKRIEIEEAVTIIRSVASALSLAHSKGIVHRDLKPDNILLVDLPEPNTVKIVDFGLAKILTEKNQKLTQTGELLGTSLYMSPEQCKGKSVDHRTDIFSLGICFYELLTGSRPFDADTAIGVMYQIMNDDMRKLGAKELKSHASQLNAILSKCLQKDPADRYQTMDDLISELDALFSPHFAAATNTLISTKHSRSYIGLSPLTAKLIVAALLILIFVYGSFVLHKNQVSELPKNWSYVPAVCVHDKDFRDRQAIDSMDSAKFIELLQKKKDESDLPYFSLCISQSVFQYSVDKMLAPSIRLKYALAYEDMLIKAGFPSQSESFYKLQIKPQILALKDKNIADGSLKSLFSKVTKRLVETLIDAGKVQSAKNILLWYLRINQPNEDFSIEDVIYAELRMDEPELVRAEIKKVSDLHKLSIIICSCRLFHRFDLVELCLQKLKADSYRFNKPENMILVYSTKALNYLESDEPVLVNGAVNSAFERFEKTSKPLNEAFREPCYQLALALELANQFKEARKVQTALAEANQTWKRKDDCQTSLEFRTYYQAEKVKSHSEKLEDTYVLVDSLLKLGLPFQANSFVQAVSNKTESPTYFADELRKNLTMAKCLSYYNQVRMEARLFAAFAIARKIAKQNNQYNFADFCAADIPLNKYEQKRIVLGWEIPPDQRDVFLVNQKNYETVFMLFLRYGQYHMAEDCLRKMRREFMGSTDELARDTLSKFENLLKLELKPNDISALQKLCSDYENEPVRKKGISPYFFLALSVAGLGIDATKIERRFETFKRGN